MQMSIKGSGNAYTVTSIGEWAFQAYKDIKGDLTIPDTQLVSAAVIAIKPAWP